ncbi:MAG: hypothetical protein ABIJ26_00840 [Candidatus Margulisiibacteriota bacterium]|nr:hypothetical protein [Candidatus Margulisiibacteriota bacterium]
MKKYLAPSIKEVNFDAHLSQGVCYDGSGDDMDCGTGTAPQGGFGSCKAGINASGMCEAGTGVT